MVQGSDLHPWFSVLLLRIGNKTNSNGSEVTCINPTLDTVHINNNNNNTEYSVRRLRQIGVLRRSWLLFRGYNLVIMTLSYYAYSRVYLRRDSHRSWSFQRSLTVVPSRVRLPSHPIRNINIDIKSRLPTAEPLGENPEEAIMTKPWRLTPAYSYTVVLLCLYCCHAPNPEFCKADGNSFKIIESYRSGVC
jgi:hypothetical protein